MKRTLVVIACLSLACGRVETVFRGATSVFRSTEPAPMHDTPKTDADLSVLWVGHATVLVQMRDRFIATDPVTTPTVGQLSKRLVAPGLSANEFPRLDLAVVSHVHYDHLSFASLVQLEHKIDYLVLPTGGLAYLPDFAFDATEVEAWTFITRGDLTVTSVPAHHRGWRFAFDGWSHAMGGWVLQHAKKTVYFAGDTGYDKPMFDAIAKRFPAIDLAMLPIAPMEPHGLMGDWHMNPREAVQAFLDLHAARMMPIHYDTFINSLDQVGEAIPALLTAVDEAKVPREKISILQIGERRVISPRTD